MPKYVAAIDQGTTSTRFMIFDHAGNVIAVDQKEHRQIYPKPGWVEHDPLEIWQRTQDVMQGALKKLGIQKSAQIVAVGVTNQRETTVVWDKKTGKPVYNAIVWQDTRTDVIISKFAKTLRWSGQVQEKNRLATGDIFFGSQDQMDFG
jgi:glycerol kinase